MQSEVLVLPLQLTFESISRQLLHCTECPMGLGNDTWDMRCTLRPIYAASGCAANGHRSPATPSQLTGKYRPTPDSRCAQLEVKADAPIPTATALTRSFFAYLIGQDGKTNSKPLRYTTSLAFRAVSIIAEEALGALSTSPP
jgi:hypothetical protein